MRLDQAAQPFYTVDYALPPALVQVAETREKRSVLAAEIIKGVMLPQFAILPLARYCLQRGAQLRGMVRAEMTMSAATQARM